MRVKREGPATAAELGGQDGGRPVSDGQPLTLNWSVDSSSKPENETPSSPTRVHLTHISVPLSTTYCPKTTGNLSDHL